MYYQRLSPEEAEQFLRKPFWPLFWACSGLFLLAIGPLQGSIKEHLFAEQVAKFPIREGTVIERFRAPYLTILDRPVLVIQPDGYDFTVEAFLVQNQIFDFRNRVKFHFSGDPGDEIRLIGETDPFFSIAIFAVIGFALPAFFMLAVYFLRKRAGIS